MDNGTAGFHAGFTLATPYGYYSIDGSTAASSLPVGSVTVSNYYDATTRKVYVPTEQGSGGIDGTAGLGSESADTTDQDTNMEFGFGGLYEAKQSEVRHFTFTFRYDDGSFYQGDFASSTHLYLPGTLIHVPGGYYDITAFDDEHSAIPSGTVHVSSYFDIGTGRFYTPVRYAEGKNAGSGDIGSEVDYIFAGGGLRSFGGPTHQEANTKLNTLLLTTARYAFDGPIQGATIGYLDPQAASGTPGIDPHQPTSVTSADGSYQIDPGTGPLVLTGGTDTATELPFKGILESAGTGSVLSPITTLLEAVAIALGDTSAPGITAANDLLSTALGLPADIDLTTYAPGQVLRDPTTSANDIPSAEAVYRAGAKLLDVETLIDAAGGNSQAAIGTLAAALADGSVTDLAGLNKLIEDGALAPPAETAIKAIVTATNAAVDQQLAGVTVPAAILALISGGSIALQGDAAMALAAAGADDAAVADHFVQTLPATLVADDLKASGVTPPPTVSSVGTGADQLALKLSEDAYQGNAAYTVSVDGQQIGGTLTAASAHGEASDTLLVNGSWGDGPHTFTVDFLNDLYGGSTSTDRNLYVDSATYNGASVSGAQAALYGNGPLSLEFNQTPSTTPTSIGSGPDQLALDLSEDAYQGDAQYTVSVDGQEIGGPQTAFAAHGKASDTLLVNGDWAPGAHTFTVDFLNDRYGGSASTDRNLYVDGATYNGATVSGAQAALYGSGPRSFAFHTATPS